MAFSLASVRQPSAMVVVHTTRMAIGMEDTKSTVENASANRGSAPLRTSTQAASDMNNKQQQQATSNKQQAAANRNN
jgi:hypothetical protein